MDDFLSNGAFFLLLVGLGTIYLSRFVLRNHVKMTGEELAKIDSSLEEIHSDYSGASIMTAILLAVILFAVYKGNQSFWEERVVLLFIPYIVVPIFIDGGFAISTKVFPATTKNRWNRYVYDAEGKYRWVAQLQVGIGVALLIADHILYRLSL